MDWFKKAPEEKAPEPVVPVEKADTVCEVDGCFEVKAPGQNHVCVKHIRAS